MLNTKWSHETTQGSYSDSYEYREAPHVSACLHNGMIHKLHIVLWKRIE